jgi:hypothetical protein
VKELEDRIRWAAPGATLGFTVARYGRRHEVSVIAGKAPPRKWRIVPKRTRSLPERKLGEAWLEA